MSPNLQIELRAYVTSNVVSKLNKFYFENDALLNKAIDAAFGTVLLGILNKIKAEDLYKDSIEYITETEFYKEIDFGASRLLSIDDCYRISGDSLLSQFFEYKKGRISEMISNEIGVKSETAVEVFNFAILLIFAYLNHHQIKSEELLELIEDQKRRLLNSIPGGIKLILGYPYSDVVEEQESKRISRSIFGSLFSAKMS